MEIVCTLGQNSKAPPASNLAGTELSPNHSPVIAGREMPTICFYAYKMCHVQYRVILNNLN